MERIKRLAIFLFILLIATSAYAFYMDPNLPLFVVIKQRLDSLDNSVSILNSDIQALDSKIRDLDYRISELESR